MNINDAINAIIDNDDALAFALRTLLLIDSDLADAIDNACDYDDNNYARERRTIALTLMHDLLTHADTETMTMLRLDHSLCPMHAIDYAICFDDENDECDAIRTIHPSHDS